MILTLKIEIRGRLRKWFCIRVLKRPLHITVHREIPAQIDEVVLCGHRHYAKIFPVSNWLFEIHGLSGAFAADTPNGCFRPQPMQNSVRSGRKIVHRKTFTQIDKVVLWSHYEHILPISNWLLEIRGPGAAIDLKRWFCIPVL